MRKGSLQLAVGSGGGGKKLKGGKAEKLSGSPASKKVTRRGSAGAAGKLVTAANRWREMYNPFRGFAIARAVELLEAGQRGDYALLQWTYRKLERSYPTLGALIARCEAPLMNFDWTVKVKSRLPAGWTEEDAARQQETLYTAYDALDNLTEAIRHLHMAEFREYAHLQKHRSGSGAIMHLECLDQWNVCRDGLYGDWYWNPEGRLVTAPAHALGEDRRIGGAELPMEDFIIRQVPLPINEVAIVSFVRWGLVQKNWDAFVEIYGVPGGVVEMPPNVPAGKEAEYETSARGIAEGGVGAIPSGSKYFPNDGPRGTDPFSPRIRQLDEDLIMRGTGGRMGMLAAAAGLGGGNQGETHEDVFQEIARSRAAEISEVLQRGFDLDVLGREHAGEPALVYFDLAPKDEADVDGIVGHVVSLAGAGWKADGDWLREQTGYEVEEEESWQLAVGSGQLAGGSGQEAEDGGSGDDEAMAARLEELAAAKDEDFEGKLAAFNRDFPGAWRVMNGRTYDPLKNPKGGPKSHFLTKPVKEAEIKANIQRGLNAMRRVYSEEIDMPSAMHRDDVGDIDFLWDHNGYGIKHIISRRDEQNEKRPDLNKLGPFELLDILPKVIARGKVANPESKLDTVEVEYEGIRVLLAKRKGKSKNAWLLSGFEIDPESQRKGESR